MGHPGACRICDMTIRGTTRRRTNTQGGRAPRPHVPKQASRQLAIVRRKHTCMRPSSRLDLPSICTSLPLGAAPSAPPQRADHTRRRAFASAAAPPRPQRHRDQSPPSAVSRHTPTRVHAATSSFSAASSSSSPLPAFQASPPLTPIQPHAYPAPPPQAFSSSSSLERERRSTCVPCSIAGIPSRAPSLAPRQSGRTGRKEGSTPACPPARLLGLPCPSQACPPPDGLAGVGADSSPETGM